jgi:iron complex outermembrane receptor protein
MARNVFRSGLLLTCATAGVVAAAEPAAAQDRRFDVPAQPAATAIPAFARQAGLQILAPEAAVKELRTQAVVGVYSTDAGLALLLQGTGLRVASRNGRTLILVASPQGGNAAGSAAPDQVSEVVVTGSNLKTPDTPTPINTYGARKIAQSGQVRLETFMNSLPEVSLMAAAAGSTRYGGTSTVRLRGLPEGSAAVLLDGRRTGVAGLNVRAAFDIGSIPVAMIDRIDVVPIGSSAIYGSDAIGGVVNIVLKKRFEGLDVVGSYSVADQHEERDVSLAYGRAWERASASVAFAYHDNDGLFGVDRELTRSSDFTRFASKGGTDWRQQICTPGTVRAVSGNLNGLTSNVAAIPAAGADQAANYRAGSPNLCSPYAQLALVTPSDRRALLLSGDYELGANATLYAQLLVSRVENNTRSTYGRSINGLVVPANNPFNPFGQNVTVTTAVPISSGTLLTSDTVRPVIGARGRLGERWDWDVSAWGTLIHDDVLDAPETGTVPILTALLARTNPATALNPFNVSSNSAAVLAEAAPVVKMMSHGELFNISGVLRGELFSLPAGPIKAAFGAEARHEGYNRRSYSGFSEVLGDGARDAAAVFAEAAVPLLGVPDEPAKVEATLAGRYDRFSDFGGRFTPSVGLQARGADGLRLTATYSTSFKAPGLTWMNFPRSTYANSTGLVDPVRGESYPMTLYIGGNPDLKPETGKAYSAGFTWDSRRFEGLHAGLTYWRLTMEDRVGVIPYQTLIQLESLFPGRVVREPTTGGVAGRIISVDSTYLNFGDLRLRGVDLNARYDWSTDWGVWTPSIAMTRTLQYESKLLPNQPFQDRLSRATSSDAWAPRYKATVGMAWRNGAASASLQGRYVGSYLDYQDRPNTSHLGDFWLVDASAEVPLTFVSKAATAERAYARIAVSNLLNRLPDYSNFNSGIYGYDPYQSDLIGRMVTVSLGYRF